MANSMFFRKKILKNIHKKKKNSFQQNSSKITPGKKRDQWPLLLSWFNFNPCTDK